MIVKDLSLSMRSSVSFRLLFGRRPAKSSREAEAPVKYRISRRVVAYLFLLLIVIVLVPSMVTWAVKSGSAKPSVSPNGDIDQRDLDKAALNYFQRMAAPDRERPLGLSLFEDFKPNVPPLPKRKGLIVTQAGLFNPKDVKAFDALPSDLRGVVAHPAPQGKGLGLGSGTGIIQISEEAVKSTGYNNICLLYTSDAADE